jgi:hypothetical protein
VSRDNLAERAGDINSVIRLIHSGKAAEAAREFGERKRGPEADVRRHTNLTSQVMVNVTGGGRGMRAIAVHLRYISKSGRLPFEDDRGVERDRQGAHVVGQHGRSRARPVNCQLRALAARGALRAAGEASAARVAGARMPAVQKTWTKSGVGALSGGCFGTSNCFDRLGQRGAAGLVMKLRRCGKSSEVSYQWHQDPGAELAADQAGRAPETRKGHHLSAGPLLKKAINLSHTPPASTCAPRPPGRAAPASPRRCSCRPRAFRRSRPCPCGIRRLQWPRGGRPA